MNIIVQRNDLNEIPSSHGSEDLLKGIVIGPQTRRVLTTFRLVKGHAGDYGNIRVDALANA